ncbi:TetR family transcriptional regulator [Bacillus cereus]|nr:TetR family transcriptional regulator [Bacillus cereus]
MIMNIARDIEYSHGVIYYYFKSKEELAL